MFSLQSFLLGRKSPAEVLRAHQRALNKAQRELDRERMKLEKQEHKVIMDIKRAAKIGQMVRKQAREPGPSVALSFY